MYMINKENHFTCLCRYCNHIQKMKIENPDLSDYLPSTVLCYLKHCEQRRIKAHSDKVFVVVVVVLVFYVHGKHLRSCRDGQLT